MRATQLQPLSAVFCAIFAAVTGCKPAPKLSPADTAGLDDEFAGQKLGAEWSVFKGDTFKRQLKDGELVITPHKNVVWYMVDNGPMLSKPVTGNFRMTTVVRARSIKTPDKPPTATNYQFGGLIMRDPASDKSGKENYIFNVVGYRNGYLSVETKTTVDDESEVDGPKWDSGDAELRICRHNEKFLVLKRHIGEKKWVLGQTYSRKDMPATLQAGPIAYTYTDEQDLNARFEFIKYAPVKTVADCYVD